MITIFPIREAIRRRVALQARAGVLIAAALLAGCATTAGAQPAGAAAEPSASTLTFVDLADLVERAPVIATAEIRRQATVEPERAVGLAPGHVRLYLEADTEAVLTGRSPLGESLRFLADMPLQLNSRAPRITRERFVLFADTVPGRPGELQLIDPGAMIPADPGLEARLRSVIAAFAAADAPSPIIGIRDVISVPGNLTGESETQMFVDTESGAPLALSVIRRPGMAPTWGVSWSEIVDQSARPPVPETVEWYRLACFLPPQLPLESFLQEEAAPRAQAQEDYRLVLEELGPCIRSRS